MNWKKFKLQIESAGVNDDMEIEYIDLPAVMYRKSILVIINKNSFGVVV